MMSQKERLIIHPLFTQYCDGRRVSCPNWMTQWGSKALGDQGYSPIEILRYYYGEDVYIKITQNVEFDSDICKITTDTGDIYINIVFR